MGYVAATAGLKGFCAGLKASLFLDALPGVCAGLGLGGVPTRWPADVYRSNTPSKEWDGTGLVGCQTSMAPAKPWVWLSRHCASHIQRWACVFCPGSWRRFIFSGSAGFTTPDAQDQPTKPHTNAPNKPCAARAKAAVTLVCPRAPRKPEPHVLALTNPTWMSLNHKLSKTYAVRSICRAWLACMFRSLGCSTNLYPLLMKSAYGIGAHKSSLYYRARGGNPRVFLPRRPGKPRKTNG